jgi:hypothetical protein
MRYLLTFYAIWLGFFLTVILLVGGPAWIDERATDLVWQIPVGSAAMMSFQYRFALKTPSEARRNFWSYRFANLMFAGVVVITLVAVLTVD